MIRKKGQRWHGEIYGEEREEEPIYGFNFIIENCIDVAARSKDPPEYK